MIQLLIGSLIGLLAGGGIAAWCCKWDLVLATDERKRAARLLLESEEMLAAAETNAVRADALTTPTGEYQTIAPKVTVRFGAALQSAQDWARETFLAPSDGPAWAPAELASLAPARPPLRVRGEVAATRRSWPLMPRLLPPSPLFDAAPFSLSSLGGAQ